MAGRERRDGVTSGMNKDKPTYIFVSDIKGHLNMKYIKYLYVGVDIIIYMISPQWAHYCTVVDQKKKKKKPTPLLTELLDLSW